MEFDLEDQSTLHRFQSFEGEAVTVSGRLYTTSIVISPTEILTDWPPKHVDELQIDDFQMILDLKPELAIVGTGVHQHFPSPRLFTMFMGAGVGIDFMNSRAACRTYNILAAEGRYIAAGIIVGGTNQENLAVKIVKIVMASTLAD